MSNDLPFTYINLYGRYYTPSMLQPYLMGKGTERWCFRDPVYSNRVLKVSEKKHSKQTRRENAYFRFLQRRSIPFKYIPGYFGRIQGKHYVGLFQELIENYDGSRPEIFINFMQSHFSQAKKLLHNLYCYLYQYNILPCDLTRNNMLVVEQQQGKFQLILIDGLGCTDLFPLAQYIPFMGRLKIKRKFDRLLHAPDFYPFFSTEEERKKFLNQTQQ